MKEYKLDPEKLKIEKRNIILLYSISALVLLLITYFMNRKNSTNASLLYILPLMVILFAYSGFRAFKQRQNFWSEYQLKLDENTLIQSQPRFPEISITRDEVSRIEERKVGLILSTKKHPNILVITRDLSDADYDEIKNTLSKWVAIERKGK